MNVLGISGLYHDSAAALISEGNIIAAVQEERFTRKKHDKRFPVNAIEYCLGLGYEIDAVIYYDNPLYTLERQLDNLCKYKDSFDSLYDVSLRDMLKKKIWIHKSVQKVLKNKNIPIYVSTHHMSHAASAFFPSPFEKAICIIMDGVGEWDTVSIFTGCNNELEQKETISYPHSLGLFYSAFTYFCGFKVNEGDYKFMGLAPYGEPIYYDMLKEKVIKVRNDGSFELCLDYFDYYRGRCMISSKLEKMLGKPRETESLIGKREMDIAASVQKITEEIILNIINYAKSKYGKDINSLVMAGGVALNCVANGKIAQSGIFDKIWIQPAAGDAGGALGAALWGYYKLTGNNRKIDKDDSQNGSYLGNFFSNKEIEAFLKSKNIKYKYFKDVDEIKVIASLLYEDKVVGLFRGRMEFGPRALGNRSILASPLNPDMQRILNLKVKKRESFRPFAPIVIEEDVHEYFDIQDNSPYMLLTGNINEKYRYPFNKQKILSENSYDMLSVINYPKSVLPAVTHVDYSSRIQTVSSKSNDYIYKLLVEFKKISGFSVLVNTSFNVRGEPIVCSIDDAWQCFLSTDIDVLVLENYLIYKNDIPNSMLIRRRIEELD